MIPRKLHLSNFLSYGEKTQTIDFTHYSLMCLSGKNGHGKSAILDAITWSLWGQARKTSGNAKADSGLLRLGSTRMIVSFDFDFNGRAYRVRREYAQTHGKPFASLDFEVKQKDDSFVSLTDKTIRATQAKIEELIGLDYETFVNSAYLRQGQSNEFSKKSAKDRKNILATILGLSKYDRLQAKASEKAREHAVDKAKLLSLQEQAAVQLEQREVLEGRQNEHAATIKALSEQLTSLKKSEQALEKERAELKVLQEQSTSLDKKSDQLHGERDKQQSELLALYREWKDVHARKLHAANIEKLEEKRHRMLKHELKLRELQQKSLHIEKEVLVEEQELQKRWTLVTREYEQKLYSCKIAVERIQMSLKTERSALNQKNELLALSSKQLEVVGAEQKKNEETRKNLALDEKEFAQFKAQFEKRRAAYQRWCSMGNMIAIQIKEHAHKIDVLKETQGAACPTCEQMLSAKRRSFLHTQFEHTQKTLQKKQARLVRLTSRLKQLLTEQHAQLQEKEKKHTLMVQGAVKAEEQVRRAAELKTTIERTDAECHALNKKIELLDKQSRAEQELLAKQSKTKIKDDTKLVAIGARITILNDGKKALGYDKEEHEGLLKDLEALDAQLKDLSALKKDVEKQGQRAAMIQQHVARLKTLKKEVVHVTKQREAFKTLEATGKDFDQRFTAFSSQMNELVTNKEAALQELGKCDNHLAQLAQVQKDVKKREKSIKEIDQNIDHYQTLAQAFGKNGIQALLIEQAIPEIENEANELLGRLTDNQSQVFIESLRDLKKGGVQETLDIQISDASGVRPYEMFSGGEAFRIDFALRIAISKLLARRAGTALQTLIIDEGFGSQDEQGLQCLMDAIHVIQHDFAKIIVVSHLDVFKNNFPVHLCVEKTSTGSHVTVQERG